MDSPLARQLEEWSDAGLRVPLFAHNPAATTLHDADGEPHLSTIEAFEHSLLQLHRVRLLGVVNRSLVNCLCAFGI